MVIDHGAIIKNHEKAPCRGKVWGLFFHRWIVVVFAGFYGLWLAGSPAPAASAPTLVAARIGIHDAVTRFVVEFSEPVTWTFFTLADPYRVVIDLPEVERNIPVRNLGAGVISRYRHGVFRKGTARLVLDTHGPVRIVEAFMAPADGKHGPRLVIELMAGNREDFIVTAGWPAVASVVARESSSAPSSFEADGQPQERETAVKPLPARRRTIVIDPGHGGDDPGAIGVSGTSEKRITMAFGQELARQLRDQGRYSVVMTRDRDTRISLPERVKVARGVRADLLVSIHADAIKKTSVRGLSVYTLSERASDKEAAALAARENAVDEIAGQDLSDEIPEVRDILIDLVQRDTKNLSVRFARGLLSEAGDFVRLLPRSHRYAGFYVLKAPDVPSVLVELGFLTNHADEKQLLSHSWRRRVASQFVEAIDAYFAKRNHNVY